MAILTEPKKCIKCKRVIRESNKSGYCSSCSARIKNEERRKKKCGICKEPCSGKLLIEVAKERYISLCIYHFNILNMIDDIKEIRKKIKYLRSYH